MRDHRCRPAQGENPRQPGENSNPPRVSDRFAFGIGWLVFLECFVTANPPKQGDNHAHERDGRAMRVCVGGAERGDEEAAGDEKDFGDLDEIGIGSMAHALFSGSDLTRPISASQTQQ